MGHHRLGNLNCQRRRQPHAHDQRAGRRLRRRQPSGGATTITYNTLNFQPTGTTRLRRDEAARPGRAEGVHVPRRQEPVEADVRRVQPVQHRTRSSATRAATLVELERSTHRVIDRPAARVPLRRADRVLKTDLPGRRSTPYGGRRAHADPGFVPGSARPVSAIRDLDDVDARSPMAERRLRLCLAWATSTARLWSRRCPTSDAPTPLAMLLTVSCSSIAPAPIQHHPGARGRSPRWPRSCAVLGRRRGRRCGGCLTSTLVTQAFDERRRPPRVCPDARPAADGANSRRGTRPCRGARWRKTERAITGLIVLAPLRGGLEVDTSPPDGCRRETQVAIRQPMASQRFTAVRFSWSIQRFPGGNSFVSRWLQPSPRRSSSGWGRRFCATPRSSPQLWSRRGVSPGSPKSLLRSKYLDHHGAYPGLGCAAR